MQILTYTRKRSLKIQLATSKVSAGFPSPADDYLENALDLNEHLINNPSATFYVRASGDSMIGANINDGDLLIVDRSQDCDHQDIAIALLDGEFTVKRLIKKGGVLQLKAENPFYPTITIQQGQDFEVWGKVIHVIHSLNKKKR